MEQEINAFANCYRKMLNIKRIDHTPLTEIYERTERISLIYTIRKRQLGWLVHTLRQKNKDESTKLLALYEPANSHGKHKRGAKQLSYIRQISQLLSGEKCLTDCEIDSMAQNRDEWRKRLSKVVPA